MILSYLYYHKLEFLNFVNKMCSLLSKFMKKNIYHKWVVKLRVQYMVDHMEIGSCNKGLRATLPLKICVHKIFSLQELVLAEVFVVVEFAYSNAIAWHGWVVTIATHGLGSMFTWCMLASPIVHEHYWKVNHSHMTPIQTYDCILAQKKISMFKKFGLSCVCFPFLKHLNVAVSNLLENHLSTLLHA